jgi:hypothetical protein
MSLWLEQLWGDLLSGEESRVRKAWKRLKVEEQMAVYQHLLKMTQEEGWASVQKESAQAALRFLSDDRPR